MKDNQLNGNGGSNTSGLTYLLIGGGIGAAIALLFAPKPGSELRSQVADVTRKGYDATLEKAASLKEQSAEVLQTVKDKTSAVYDFASSKLSSGSDVNNDPFAAASEAVLNTSNALAGEVKQISDDMDSASKQFGTGRKASNIV